MDDRGINRAVQLFPHVDSQLRDEDSPVAKLAERNPKRRSARAGKKARAQHQLAALRSRVPRPCVRSGDEGALPLAPDDVGAAVGQHPHGGARAAPHPQAGKRMAQGRRRQDLSLEVRVRFVQDGTLMACLH